MLKVTVIAGILVCVFAAPVEILRNERVDNADGSYSFLYETSDGQYREETAHVVHRIDKDPILVVTGLYSYVGPDGQTYKVQYVADDNGFRPQGDHIPKAPQEQLIQLPVELVTVSPFEGSLPPPVALPPNAINSLLG